MNGIQWFDNARIYHIMVDRFNGGWQKPPASENAFCGGNLCGVIDKLEYIKNLGFNAIMLTPFLKTASYHGYCTLDYDEVDSHFGTWAVFQELLDKAHDMGIRVICDFVSNHCSYWSDVFQEALLSKGGKHRDWFFFPKKGSDEYVSFLNLPDLPKFNLENSKAAEFMVSKAERLAKMGVDGFRIDHALGQPFPFLRNLRQTIKNVRKDIVVFGEVWAEGISEEHYNQLYFKTRDRQDELLANLRKLSHRLFPFLGSVEEEGEDGDDDNIKVISQEHIQTDYADVLDGVLDFTYRGILLDEIKAGRHINMQNQHLRNSLIEHFRNYPNDFNLVLFLDNHDTDRFLFECKNDKTIFEEAIEFTKSLNRPFSILYGTEQFMNTETSILDAEDYADLRVRQCMDWTQTPANILKVKDNNLTLIHQKEMPIINGTSWSLEDNDKSTKESKKDNTQFRKMTNKDMVVWLSVAPKWDIHSLVLQDDVKSKLQEIAAYITKKDTCLKKWGINRFMRNESCVCINFYGASGTGKSIGAEAVAEACGLQIIKASYSQIQSDRWGGTENNLTSLFEEAKRKRSIIILNEADGLFSKRRSDGANSDTNNQIKCHLLNLMDTYEVILILTTNRFEDYDEAFYRRTMFQVEFPLPGHDELLQLWKMHLGCSDERRFSEGGEIPKSRNFVFDNIVSHSDAISGGDIKRITLAVVGKLLAADVQELTEEMLISVVEDYKRTKLKMSLSGFRTVDGKLKEDIENVIKK